MVDSEESHSDEEDSDEEDEYIPGADIATNIHNVVRDVVSAYHLLSSCI